MDNTDYMEHLKALAELTREWSSLNFQEAKDLIPVTAQYLNSNESNEIFLGILGFKLFLLEAASMTYNYYINDKENKISFETFKRAKEAIANKAQELTDLRNLIDSSLERVYSDKPDESNV